MALITTSDKTFTLQQDETLLEGLERTGHEVEYQCRSGYCGSCRLRLLSGQVSYPEQPLAFIAAEEILPCCCKAETDLHVVCHLRSDTPENNPDLFEDDLFPAGQN
ncbi:class I ribonucleotide reductase maintenance protein YfaE [Snodgrassella alvi]|uniref:class I ribonucleotide reductase maintenance protein YfaE n=1 Tax=Snodgrassella TaxID=1193515 RepID=UPI0034E89187